MAEPGAKSEIAVVNALNAACEAARERWRASASEENLREISQNARTPDAFHEAYEAHRMMLSHVP